MTVIIPHPAEELKLIRLQKRLISHFYSGGFSAYRTIPLWFPVEDEAECRDKSGLKALAEELKEVCITSVSLGSDGSSITARLEIHRADRLIQQDFPIVRLVKKAQQQDLLQLQSDFPMRLKVFRLGLAEQKGNTSFLICSVWKKLRQTTL